MAMTPDVYGRAEPRLISRISRIARIATSLSLIGHIARFGPLRVVLALALGVTAAAVTTPTAAVGSQRSADSHNTIDG